ncbi:hypothetical protein [Methylobacillus flagellatus]|uniref:hypothetical protein n=1 Tax=Methylobacillus flagellatus TaxID=405 RepID=UPI0010F5639B|nr:hypothetical protein [Methylobacillus flagellatus]
MFAQIRSSQIRFSGLNISHIGLCIAQHHISLARYRFGRVSDYQQFAADDAAGLQAYLQRYRRDRLTLIAMDDALELRLESIPPCRGRALTQLLQRRLALAYPDAELRCAQRLSQPGVHSKPAALAGDPTGNNAEHNGLLMALTPSSRLQSCLDLLDQQQYRLAHLIAGASLLPRLLTRLNLPIVQTVCYEALPQQLRQTFIRHGEVIACRLLPSQQDPAACLASCVEETHRLRKHLQQHGWIQSDQPLTVVLVDSVHLHWPALPATDHDQETWRRADPAQLIPHQHILENSSAAYPLLLCNSGKLGRLPNLIPAHRQRALHLYRWRCSLGVLSACSLLTATLYATPTLLEAKRLSEQPAARLAALDSRMTDASPASANTTPMMQLEQALHQPQPGAAQILQHVGLVLETLPQVSLMQLHWDSLQPGPSTLLIELHDTQADSRPGSHTGAGEHAALTELRLQLQLQSSELETLLSRFNADPAFTQIELLSTGGNGKEILIQPRQAAKPSSFELRLRLFAGGSPT